MTTQRAVAGAGAGRRPRRHYSLPVRRVALPLGVKPPFVFLTSRLVCVGVKYFVTVRMNGRHLFPFRLRFRKRKQVICYLIRCKSIFSLAALKVGAVYSVCSVDTESTKYSILQRAHTVRNHPPAGVQ
jgi:hypothetical protein